MYIYDWRKGGKKKRKKWWWVNDEKRKAIKVSLEEEEGKIYLIINSICTLYHITLGELVLDKTKLLCDRSYDTIYLMFDAQKSIFSDPYLSLIMPCIKSFRFLPLVWYLLVEMWYISKLMVSF